MAKLRFLARATIRRYNPTIVGVTGSVGKTSAKEAVRAVLSHGRRVRASAKSFNNEVGLPLNILGDWSSTEGWWFYPWVIVSSLWRLAVRSASYPEVIVLEYGIDRPGDMTRLLSIAHPSVAVFTAVGETPVHVEFFPSPEAILHEKAKLITQLPMTGFAVLNADDVRVIAVGKQTRARVLTYGFAETADVRVVGFGVHRENGATGVTFKLVHGGNMVPVRLNGVLGRSQAYAVAAAASVGLVCGMNLIDIAEALAHYAPPPGRLRLIPGLRGSLLLDDTYNASPLAVQEGLEALKSLKAKRSIAVLGDMLELGKYTLEGHENIGRLAAKCVDLLVTVGLRGKFIAESALRAGMPRKSVVPFMTVNEATVYLQGMLKRDDAVLLKASQSVRMEKVTKELMGDPLRAEELLVRQNPAWLEKPGLYDT